MRRHTSPHASRDHVLGYPGALWRSADEYDQIGTAQEIETPMYLLQGERDYQVSVEQDFELWQDELADRPDTTFELYEGLNHIFQHADGPSTQSEYLLSNSVDEAVVEDVAAWVTSL